MSEEILIQILAELKKKNGNNISFKDLIIYNTVLIGAILTVFTLIWQTPPTNGIITVSFYLFISFTFFVNSVSANSKANFYYRSSEVEVSMKHGERLMTFAEVLFGFGFTLVISALSILGYEYLKDFTSQHLISFLLPVIFLAAFWFGGIANTYVDHLKFKKRRENEIIKRAKFNITIRTVIILVVIVSLIFIILDYFGIFLIQ